jgi:hypothetical protein
MKAPMDNMERMNNNVDINGDGSISFFIIILDYRRCNHFFGGLHNFTKVTKAPGDNSRIQGIFEETEMPLLFYRTYDHQQLPIE